MSFSGVAVAYCAVGGLVAYSGVKGATLADTAKGVLSGNLNLSDTETISHDTSPPSSGSGSTPATGGSAPVGNPSQYQQYAFSLFPQFGWGTDQEQPLVSLWNQESGWNPNAKNPTSTAYGIAQFLDTTWGPYGAKTSDWQLQIRYGLEYIRDRYGNPAMAWGHEQQNNWY